jgi:hypothetical protein
MAPRSTAFVSLARIGGVPGDLSLDHGHWQHERGGHYAGRLGGQLGLPVQERQTGLPAGLEVLRLAEQAVGALLRLVPCPLLLLGGDRLAEEPVRLVDQALVYPLPRAVYLREPTECDLDEIFLEPVTDPGPGPGLRLGAPGRSRGRGEGGRTRSRGSTGGRPLSGRCGGSGRSAARCGWGSRKAFDLFGAVLFVVPVGRVDGGGFIGDQRP